MNIYGVPPTTAQGALGLLGFAGDRDRLAPAHVGHRSQGEEEDTRPTNKEICEKTSFLGRKFTVIPLGGRCESTRHRYCRGR